MTLRITGRWSARTGRRRQPADGPVRGGRSRSRGGRVRPRPRRRCRPGRRPRSSGSRSDRRWYDFSLWKKRCEAEHRGACAARPAADVLGPAVAGVAGPAEAIAGVAADEVAAVVADREPLGVRPADLRADPAVELERGDVPTAGAAAGAARGDPAAGPGAVHQPEVVGLDGRPAAATDRAAASAADLRRHSSATVVRGRRLGRLPGRLERRRGPARRAGRRRRSSRRRLTSIETVVPYGSADVGVKTRTVSCSAQRIVARDRLAGDADREGPGGAAAVHRRR